MMSIVPLEISLQQVYVPYPPLGHVVSDHWFAVLSTLPTVLGRGGRTMQILKTLKKV